MALFVFSNLNKYGNLRQRVVYQPTTQFTLKNPSLFGPVIMVRPFHYESKTPGFGLVESKGKKYLTPGWVEVHPQTTIQDIVYVAPVVEEEPKIKNVWVFESESGNGTYKVRQNGDKLTCNCMGFFRSRERKCKHIKSIENGKI